MAASTLTRPASPSGNAPHGNAPSGTAPNETDRAAVSLLVTGDEHLADTIASLAAAANHPLRRVRHPSDALVHWQRAPMVLVGADAAADCIDHGMPERRELILCSTKPWAGAEPDDMSILWPTAIRLQAEHVIAVPEATDWLLDRFTTGIRGTTQAPVLAAVAGHGGAGASTFALAAASTAARHGRRTVLIDLDLDGGGIDTAAGLAAQSGWRWPSLATGSGGLEPERLLSGLPQRTGLHLVAPDPRHRVEVDTAAFGRVLRAARIAADLVVVDLPRTRTGPSARAAAAADALAVVLGESRRSWTASRGVIVDYGICTPNLGTVLRGPTAPRPELGSATDDHTPPIWGRVPTDRSLAERLHSGRPPRGRTNRRLTALIAELTDGRPRNRDVEPVHNQNATDAETEAAR